MSEGIAVGAQARPDLTSKLHIGGALMLPGIALLIALRFEFINGFNDMASAVATLIYTHSLPPHTAVIWSTCRGIAAGPLPVAAVQGP